MDLKKAEDMVKLMRAYGLNELEIKNGEDSIRIVQSGSLMGYQPQPVIPQIQPMAVPTFHGSLEPVTKAQETVQTPAAKAERRGHEIRSPFVGTFYRSAAPGEPAFVEVGKKVKAGQTLCIIEAMKLMNEIEADRDGVIKEILVDNELPVEYDQVLFLIE